MKEALVVLGARVTEAIPPLCLCQADSDGLVSFVSFYFHKT